MELYTEARETRRVDCIQEFTFFGEAGRMALDSGSLIDERGIWFDKFGI